MSRLRYLPCLAALATIPAPLANATDAAVLILIDASAEMRSTANPALAMVRTAIAKVAADDALRGAEIAVRLYGTKQVPGAPDCTDTLLVVPFGPPGADQLAPLDTAPDGRRVAGLAFALDASANDLSGRDTSTRRLVVVAGPGPRCADDACAAADRLRQAGVALTGVVMTANAAETMRELGCVGPVTLAQQPADLVRALRTAMTGGPAPSAVVAASGTLIVHAENYWGGPLAAKVEIHPSAATAAAAAIAPPELRARARHTTLPLHDPDRPTTRPTTQPTSEPSTRTSQAPPPQPTAGTRIASPALLTAGSFASILTDQPALLHVGRYDVLVNLDGATLQFPAVEVGADKTQHVTVRFGGLKVEMAGPAYAVFDRVDNRVAVARPWQTVHLPAGTYTLRSGTGASHTVDVKAGDISLLDR